MVDDKEREEISSLSASCKTDRGLKITARSRTLSSSRTFPGHG